MPNKVVTHAMEGKLPKRMGSYEEVLWEAFLLSRVLSKNLNEVRIEACDYLGIKGLGREQSIGNC